MKEDLDYYMNLNYDILIKPYGTGNNRGFEVCIPQLGEHLFVGDGDTIEEALESLESIKRELFERMLEKGKPIPEPEENPSLFSGRILLRIPKDLHKILYRKARENNVSLNQYITSILSSVRSEVQIPRKEWFPRVKSSRTVSGKEEGELSAA